MKKQLFAAAIATTIAMTMTVPAAFAQADAPAAVAQGSAKAAADQYLKQNAAAYDLQADIADLAYVTTIETGAATYVRYQQTINGAPVFTQQVTVTLDKSGQALLAVSDYTPVTSVEPIKSRKLTENEADDKAVEHLNAKGKGLWEKTSRQFGYMVQDGVAVPIYKILVHANEPFGAWENYVHAETGKVLKSKNVNQHATGTGKVFAPNPIESQGSTTGLTDNNDADYAALTAQMKTVSLLGLDGSGYLKGQYATIMSRAKTYSASLTFNYGRNSDSFEDVMAYYHIDTLQRYIQSLGITNVNNRSIVVNNGKYTADNSYYSPSTKELTFGSGGVDDAEDAGIIAHEYGHSIQDNQVPGFGNTVEGGAMGEAFGDFLGATHEDALTPNTTYGKYCVGEWDAVSYASGNPPCLRHLDENKVYPRDAVGQVHADGEIWSQPEYEMAQVFGRDVATKIIIQSHWSLTPNSGFVDGLRALRAADQALYGGAHITQINSIFGARGITAN